MTMRSVLDMKERAGEVAESNKLDLFHFVSRGKVEHRLRVLGPFVSEAPRERQRSIEYEGQDSRPSLMRSSIERSLPSVMRFCSARSPSIARSTRSRSMGSWNGTNRATGSP